MAPDRASFAASGKKSGAKVITAAKAAQILQARTRGHQWRSGRFALGGRLYTEVQCRRLEDALSIALDAAMALDVEIPKRIAFVARHLASQQTGRAPPAAPARLKKLSDAQRTELAALVEAAQTAVNECNGKRGIPLRNVAEHLFGQYRWARVAPLSREEAVAQARRLGMRAAAPQHKAMSFKNLPAPPTKEEEAVAEKQRLEAEAKDPLMVQSKEAAKKAFAKYDTAKRGELRKEDLFAVLLDLDQVPGKSKKEQEKFLDKEFKKADADGSGTVDHDEFVDFFASIIQADEAEKAARSAFAKYDVGGDNLLQKFELFQVLLEYGLVTGDTKAEKERFLETEFAKADTDGSGGVDFDEFIAFYLVVRRKVWGAELAHKKEVQKAKKAQRAMRSRSFLEASSLLEIVRGGDVALLSGRWLLERAGYERSEIERNGRTTSRYLRRGSVTPLPCRQLLEQQSPQAYLSAESFEALLQAHAEVISATRSAERDGVGAAPVVVTSHCWASPATADPHGETIGKVAEELARQMPLFEAWGFAEAFRKRVAKVRAFESPACKDWSSLYQDTVDVKRTDEQERSSRNAIHQMPLLFAHKLSTTMLVTDQTVEPPRLTRAWPFYEETLVKLFKEAPPPKRYKLPNAGPTHVWPKVVRIGDGDDASAYLAQGPPLAPSRFIADIASKVFSVDDDRPAVLADYRKTIEAGFAGLEKLVLSRRGWADSEVEQFATMIREVECPHVRELDLSANDMTHKGLEALGGAILGGALHNLEMLNLSDCSGLLSLPDAFSELHQLQTLKLDGCIGLASLPATYARIASLKAIHITHCIKLINSQSALSVLPATVAVIKEAVKEKKEKSEKKEKKEKHSSSTPR